MVDKKDLLIIITNQVVEYVTSLFNQHLQPYLLYHNLKHTKFVVSKAEEIAYHYFLSKEEIFILNVAAWFHDSGQLFSYGKNHEKKSTSLMKDFLADKEVEASYIDAIERCILATTIPHQPKTFLEEIICDADTFNLGTTDFLQTDNLLKKECELKEYKKIDDWYNMTLKFLEHHKFFTSYCNQLLNDIKQNNISIIRSKIKELK